MRHFIKIPHTCKLLYRIYSESESAESSHSATGTETDCCSVLSLDGCAVLIGRNPVRHNHYGAQSLLVHGEYLNSVNDSVIADYRVYDSTVSIDGKCHRSTAVYFLALQVLGIESVGADKLLHCLVAAKEFGLRPLRALGLSARLTARTSASTGKSSTGESTAESSHSTAGIL